MGDLAIAAACLIARAHRASGESWPSAASWPPPANEVYWHTRELLAERSRSLGVRIGEYLTKLPSAYSMDPAEADRLSDPLWPDFCHPEVLAREVMES